LLLDAADHSTEAGYMRILVAALLLAMAGPSLAAEIVVTNGDTFQVDGTIYRLDGVDAPEIDQRCLDQQATICKNSLSSFATAVTDDVELGYSSTGSRAHF
jgi:endonuclease YncB( thermonuclease family)